MVFRQMPDGSTCVSGKQDFSRREFSQGQKDHQSRFQRAVWYARAAARSQPIYAKLAEGTGRSAYNFALSDWFNPPVIHKIEREQGRIRIQASDNVMVAGVSVAILDEQGVISEQGEGVRGEGDWWEFTPTAEGKVVVEVRDLAGNKMRGESEK